MPLPPAARGPNEAAIDAQITCLAVYRRGVNPRLLLVALSVGLTGVSACLLDMAGLSETATSAGLGGSSTVTSGPSTGGSAAVTVSASSAGNVGAGGTTTTAQSGSGIGGAASSSSAESSASASSSDSSASASSSSASASSSASSSSSSGGGGTTCDSQYIGAPGYQLCAAKATSCEFNVNLNQSTSCGAVCGALGGECAQTIDNGAACEYYPTIQPCAFTGYGTALCVCSLGCGGGPPCAPNKPCNGGVCAP